MKDVIIVSLSSFKLCKCSWIVIKGNSVEWVKLEKKTFVYIITNSPHRIPSRGLFKLALG